jgi:hypothetical protein
LRFLRLAVTPPPRVGLDNDEVIQGNGPGRWPGEDPGEMIRAVAGIHREPLTKAGDWSESIGEQKAKV